MKNYFYLACIALLGITLASATACKKNADKSSNGKQNEIVEMESNAIELSSDVTISGNVKSLDAKTGVGCFFVDPEMVKSGVAASLGAKAAKGVCSDSKYGKGVPVNFSKLKQDSDYPNLPEEGVLITAKGYWKSETYAGQNNVPVFYATEYEPFF